MRVVGRLHGQFVYDRRVRVLSEVLSNLLPGRLRVIDIGCGDGLLSSLVQARCPGVVVEGADILVRPVVHIPVTQFDGARLPWPDGYFDGSLLVDVLHHAADTPGLLAEAARVSRSFVIVKDHLARTWIDRVTLRVMDWVGNAPHGVRLKYCYLSKEEWVRMFGERGLGIESWNERLPLYPSWAAWLIGRSLHFVARLEKRSQNVQVEDGPRQVEDDDIHHAASKAIPDVGPHGYLSARDRIVCHAKEIQPGAPPCWPSLVSSWGVWY